MTVETLPRVPAIPQPGQVVKVRGATWAVADVQDQGLPRGCGASFDPPPVEALIDCFVSSSRMTRAGSGGLRTRPAPKLPGDEGGLAVVRVGGDVFGTRCPGQ